MSNEEWRRPLATGEKCPLCDFGALERVNVPPTLQQVAAVLAEEVPRTTLSGSRELL